MYKKNVPFVCAYIYMCMYSFVHVTPQKEYIINIFLAYLSNHYNLGIKTFTDHLATE